MGDMAMAIFDIQSVDWIEWMSFPPEEHKYLSSNYTSYILFNVVFFGNIPVFTESQYLDFCTLVKNYNMWLIIAIVLVTQFI